MNFLLDTNVVSEWTKARPDPGVMRWLADADEDRVFISTVTLAELSYGIERLPASRRKDRLAAWLSADLAMRFEGRVLQIDPEIARLWGALSARRAAAGRPIGVMDAFIAATAETHDLTLVTRNVSDFKGSVETLINPWIG